MAKIKAVRGMYDILPDQAPIWQFVEQQVRHLFSQYGYREIRTPIIEKTELFCRSIGTGTDVVEKEMYTFLCRKGGHLTLRPEATAACVRAVEEHGLAFNQVQRLWYNGPMFRYERPQKGRQRQFHQFGAEVYGIDSPDIDAELILMTARLWRKLGIEQVLQLQLNTLGSASARTAYRAELVAFLKANMSALDTDSQRRLATNPLRILDSKDTATQALLDHAPVFLDYLDKESISHFARLKQILDDAEIRYQVNPRLVRGLDYYCKTVFEWTTDNLGAQGTVCGGGRYDGLIAQLGGRPTPGIGWAMGVERLILLLKSVQAVPADIFNPLDVYLINLGSVAALMAQKLAESLRDQLPDLRLQLHCGGGDFKSQLKKADRSGAKVALLLGEDELVHEQIQVKPLRGQGKQQNIAFVELATHLQQILCT